MHLETFEHIIWDWNGTLFDDAWLCVDVMNGLLKRRGLPALTQERYQQAFDFPVSAYYRRLGFDLEKESFEALGAEFMAAYERRRHEAHLQPDAGRVLESLRATGMSQSVLSAYRHETLEEVLRFFGLRAFFDIVIGADDIFGHGKVGQGRVLMDRLKLSPKTIAMIGDTVHDSDVAREIGVACFLIPSGNHTRARLETCGVPVLGSLAELLPPGQDPARGPRRH
jgi:phosphoglycolate phosphatase